MASLRLWDAEVDCEEDFSTGSWDVGFEGFSYAVLSGGWDGAEGSIVPPVAERLVSTNAECSRLLG